MVWAELRDQASRLARYGQRHGLKPLIQRKTPVRVPVTQPTWFGLSRRTEYVIQQQVVEEYWVLGYQPTLELDEDCDRWSGPLAGDETAGWTLRLYPDGQLMFGEWHGGREPTYVGQVDTHPASDNELALMDAIYACRYYENRPTKRYNTWEPHGWRELDPVLRTRRVW